MEREPRGTRGKGHFPGEMLWWGSIMAAETVTDALYKALSSPNPDPQVVHAAIEEVRQIASQNVIAVLGAKIDSQGARIEAEIKTQTARIDELQRVIWRVIWPLIALLTTTVFGLLYRVVAG